MMGPLHHVSDLSAQYNSSVPVGMLTHKHMIYIYIYIPVYKFLNMILESMKAPTGSQTENRGLGSRILKDL